MSSEASGLITPLSLQEQLHSKTCRNLSKISKVNFFVLCYENKQIYPEDLYNIQIEGLEGIVMEE